MKVVLRARGGNQIIFEPFGEMNKIMLPYMKGTIDKIVNF
jgi:hypothetical protein